MIDKAVNKKSTNQTKNDQQIGRGQTIDEVVNKQLTKWWTKIDKEVNKQSTNWSTTKSTKQSKNIDESVKTWTKRLRNK